MNKGRYIFYIFGILALTFSVFAGYFLYNKLYPFDSILTFYAIIHWSWLVLLYKCDFEKIKVIFPFYFIFIFVAIVPIMIMLWRSRHYPGVFFWYLLVPIISLTFGMKKILTWTCSVAILMVIVLLLFTTPYLNLSIEIPEQQRQILDIMCILFGLSISFLLIGFSIISNKSTDVAAEKHENDTNFSALYADILSYFDKKQPYLNPNFDITQLSLDLGVNQNYIGKAIKNGSGGNFNTFVNTYRINKVKTMLNENLHTKFTMEHIYKSAGFYHQATFNRAFKTITGTTPMNFAKTQKNTDDSKSI